MNPEKMRRGHERKMIMKYGEIPTPLTQDAFLSGYVKIEKAMNSALAEQPTPAVIAVVLFGSWAHGNPHEKSDIDFNIILNNGVTSSSEIRTSFVDSLMRHGLQGLELWADLPLEKFVTEHRGYFYRDFKVFSPNQRIHGIANNMRARHKR